MAVMKVLLCALLALTPALFGAEAEEQELGKRAPLLSNIGDHHRPISTHSSSAQRYFDQGLRLFYGYYYPEALSSFREAADADPECAMAQWGIALAIAPNPNGRYFRAKDDPRGLGLKAIRRAVDLGAGASLRERALIDALHARYDPNLGPDRVDRDVRDAAYARAMRAIHETYPGDADAATLYAEALMTMTPWEYWNPDGSARPGASEAERALRHAFGLNSEHPGAHHFFIHLMENSPDPAVALPSAKALETLMPDSGHVVHMPSHIYIRTGRYAEAVRSNFASIEADKRLRDEWGDRELPLDSTTTKLNSRGHHNHARNFLHMAAVRQGHYGHAIDALLGMGDNARGQKRGVQKMWLTYKRFGRWEEILEILEAPDESPLKIGMRHYVRGFAHLADGRIDEAAAELDALEAAAAVADTQKGLVPPAAMLEIAVHELAGVLDEARGDVDAAVARLGTAVRLEDGLPYMEPPRWLHPVRHTLGEVLLRAGRPTEAESVFWEDLRRNPENGRALFGLQRSLEALGEDDRADRIAERFRRAWSGADTPVEAGNLDSP